MKVQRRSARQALYGALVGSAVLGAAAMRFWGVAIDTGAATAWYGTDWEAKREVRLLQEYLRIDTTSDRGNELAAAEWLAKQFEGREVETIPMPDPMPTNIAFGGADMRDAYVTLSTRGILARARWPRPGLKLVHQGRRGRSFTRTCASPA